MNLELTLSDRPRWTENYFNNFYEENRIIKYSKDTIYIIDQNGLAKINLPNEIKKSYLKQGLTSAEFAMFKKGKSYGIITNEKAYLLSSDFLEIEHIFTIQNEFKRESYKDGNTRALIPKFSGYSTLINEVPFVFSNYSLVQELSYYSILEFNTDNLTSKWKYQTTDLLPFKLDRKLLFYWSLSSNKTFVVSPGKDIRYYTYPNYTVLESVNQVTDFKIVLKPDAKSFIRMISAIEIVVTPYEFQKGKRKTNNEQIYDLTNNRFINFSLPKEYKDFRILGKVKNKLWLINSGKQKIAQIEIE